MKRILHRTIIVAAIMIATAFACFKAHAAQVAGVEIEGLTTLSEDLVREVAGIGAGDQYSPEEMGRAVGNLRKWGVFDSVDVSPVTTPEGLIIRFRLKEATVVVSIDITGNYPYVENKIRKYLSLHPGDICSPERIEEQIERIKAFYAREGYVGTEVYVEEEHLPEWGGILLTFHVRRGESLRYRRIAIEGNRAFPKGRFVSLLNTWRAFSERKLGDSIRKLRETYMEHGYPRARIRVKEKRMDFEAHRVDLSLEVSEGPRVRLIFRGAPHMSRRLLKRTVTILREGSFDDYEIEASADALKDLLLDRGYPDATVLGTRSERAEGTIVVTFNIDEGRQRWIRQLRFEGNRDISASDLESEMTNREQATRRRGIYSPDDVPSDNEAILKAMSRKGYLKGSVRDWEVKPTSQGYALDVTIPVAEGPQTIVSEVSFRGNLAFNVAKLLGELKIKPGKPLDLPGIEEDRQQLMRFYTDNGYPYAEVSQSWEMMGGVDRAAIRYEISEGTLVRIGQILVIGDVLTSQKAIKHAMDIREGDSFSYRKIIDSQLNIRRLGPFAAVDIETIGLEGREPIVHLKVKVEEQRPFLLDLGLSFSTREKFTGSLTFTNVNAFGWAKSNSLRLTAGQRLSRAEIGWYDPRFVGSSFEMSSTGWIQYKREPTYAYSQVGGAIGWMRRLKRFGFFFRWEVDRNYFVTGDSVAADAFSLRNSTISRTSLSSSYDSRDSFSDPRRGFFTLGGVDFFNEIKGKEANFVKLMWQGENDLTFLDRITLATALRLNRILTIGRNVSVPTNELLFLGGADTIRGFGEDSLGPLDANGNAVGSRTRWIWNEEMRIRLWRTLQWAFFYDMGSLTDSFEQINLATTRNSFGVGLRYLTPVGPIRADYGFKLDRRAGESRGRFHFTFGYVF